MHPRGDVPLRFSGRRLLLSGLILFGCSDVPKYTGGLCRVRARRHVSSLSQSLGGCTNPILTRPPPGSITTVMLLRLLVRRFSQYDDLRCGRTGPLHSSRLLRLPHHTTSGGQSILEPLTKHCGLALFCQ